MFQHFCHGSPLQSQFTCILSLNSSLLWVSLVVATKIVYKLMNHVSLLV